MLELNRLDEAVRDERGADARSADVDDQDRADSESSGLARAETLLRRGALVLPLLLQ